MPASDIHSSSEFFALEKGRPRKRLSLPDVLHWRNELRIHRAYREIFCDDEGRLKPQVGLILSDLVGAAELGHVGFGLSDAKLHELHGRKTLLIWLLDRIDRDRARTDEIHKLMKESDRE